jgi:hypothetical protein
MKARHIFAMMTHKEMDDLKAVFPSLGHIANIGGAFWWRCVPPEMKNVVGRNLHTLGKRWNIKK